MKGRNGRDDGRHLSGLSDQGRSSAGVRGRQHSQRAGRVVDEAKLRVARSVPGALFELEIVRADDDWQGTRVRFHLEPREDATWVQFAHTGWPSANEHYRTSAHCWALYIRILRRRLELGEAVPYEARLGA